MKMPSMIRVALVQQAYKGNKEAMIECAALAIIAALDSIIASLFPL